MNYEVIDICQAVEDPGYETPQPTLLNYKIHWNGINKTDYAYILEHPNNDYVIGVNAGSVLGVDYNNPDDYFVQWRYGSKGGATVSSQEDIGLCCGSCTQDLKPDWMSKLYYGLNAKGINAVTNGNDLMIDGYKVAGMGKKINNNGYISYSMIISIDDKLDIIKKVSTKPMTKVPKGLSNWGITRDEVFEILGIER